MMLFGYRARIWNFIIILTGDGTKQTYFILIAHITLNMAKYTEIQYKAQLLSVVLITGNNDNTHYSTYSKVM